MGETIDQKIRSSGIGTPFLDSIAIKLNNDDGIIYVSSWNDMHSADIGNHTDTAASCLSLNNRGGMSIEHFSGENDGFRLWRKP